MQMVYKNSKMNISFNKILAAIIIVVGLCFNIYFLKDFKYESGIIESDVINYYAFLPGLIIENDLTFKFIEDNPSKYSTRYWMFKTENGNYVSKVTLGMSMMYAPFFLGSHIVAITGGFESDGFSVPYRVGILLGTLFYVFFGIYLLIKLMRKFFNEIVISFVVLLVFLATNLFYYTTREAGMSHAYSFFVIILFVYLVDRFYNKPSLVRSLFLGIVFALILLIRPTNGIVGVILPLWNLSNEGFNNRVVFWFCKQKKFLIVFLIGFLLAISPQILYWKIITGNFFYNGYSGEAHFHFLNPQVINSLFSFRKGWFLYTPVMLFIIPGLFFLYRNFRNLFWAVLAMFVLSVYLNSAWWLWWFGAGYGNRGYVDFYGVYALAIAAFLQWFIGKVNPGKIIVISGLVIIFICHNLFQVAQYMHGSLHMSGMTKEAYLFSLGKLYPKPPLYEFIVEPDKALAAKGIYPKPIVKRKTEEEWVKFYEGILMKNQDIVKMIELKANKREFLLIRC